ncbi:tail fiber protein [Aeromonas phage 2_D05]|uniref:Putative tail-fiber protein n=1 Tax=Aeromonas phage 2_D05 TaxID=2588098 RepID=A0A4Y5TWZ1_9CAUD|nr:tail fiber protein [Aeromonas phage 2_D05]QDB73912.1 putative tail-fiber protein [Aeromonas phage 2_D05]
MSVTEPGKIITPWAQSGLKNPIPPAANPATGRAGFDQGFSAINMTAKEAGGIPHLAKTSTAFSTK